MRKSVLLLVYGIYFHAVWLAALRMHAEYGKSGDLLKLYAGLIFLAVVLAAMTKMFLRLLSNRDQASGKKQES